MPRFLLILCFLSLICAPACLADEVDDDAGTNQMRIEVEDKLFVPQERADETWAFLKKRFVDDPTFLRDIDPKLSAYINVEEFFDRYYDTRSFQMYASQSGIRHRKRINLTDPTDRKNGRELMQVKVNSIDPSNREARGEFKYDIKHPDQINDREDSNPFLGIVKQSNRDALKLKLKELGIDPYDVRPVLTVHDMRSRIYILRDGEAFISISFDRVDCSMWWSTIRFTEIEPENNEIAFTTADEQGRAYLSAVNRKIVDEIHAGCPWVKQDLTPKYNKCFNRLREALPFFPLLAQTGLNNSDGFLLAGMFSLVGLAGLVFLVVKRLRGRRR